MRQPIRSNFVEPSLTRSALGTCVGLHVCYVGFDLTLGEVSMSALKKEGSERVRAGDAVGMIDCGRASKRTKGTFILLFLEGGVPPMDWLYLI